MSRLSALTDEQIEEMKRALDHVEQGLAAVSMRLNRLEMELSRRPTYTQELSDQLPIRLAQPSASDRQLDLFVSKPVGPQKRFQDL